MGNFFYWSSRTDKRVRHNEFNNLAIGARSLVIDGCDVTGAGVDMDIDVSAGAVHLNGVTVAVSAQSITLTAADPSFDRYDLILIDNTGTLVKVDGTPANPPLNGSYTPHNYVLLAGVLVQDGVTTISTSDVQDIAIRAEAFGHVRSVSSDPASGDIGEMIFNTTGSALKIWDGATWLAVSGTSVGSSDLLPDTDDTWDIGSGTYRWQDGFFSGEVSAQDFTMDPVADTTPSNGSIFLDSGVSDALSFKDGSGNTNRVRLLYSDYAHVYVRDFFGDTTNPPDQGLVGNAPTLDFDPSTNQIVYNTIDIPDDCDDTVDITVNVRYTMSSSFSGDVVLAMDVNVVSDGDDMTPASPTESTTDTFTAVATADEFDIRASTSLKISASNYAAGDTIQFKFYRNASSGSDTHTGDFRLESLDFQCTRKI